MPRSRTSREVGRGRDVQPRRRRRAVLDAAAEHELERELARSAGAPRRRGRSPPPTAAGWAREARRCGRSCASRSRWGRASCACPSTTPIVSKMPSPRCVDSSPTRSAGADGVDLAERRVEVGDGGVGGQRFDEQREGIGHASDATRSGAAHRHGCRRRRACVAASCAGHGNTGPQNASRREAARSGEYWSPGLLRPGTSSVNEAPGRFIPAAGIELSRARRAARGARTTRTRRRAA